jgi:hypothetical protein
MGWREFPKCVDLKDRKQKGTSKPVSRSAFRARFHDERLWKASEPEDSRTGAFSAFAGAFRVGSQVPIRPTSDKRDGRENRVAIKQYELYFYAFDGYRAGTACVDPASKAAQHLLKILLQNRRVSH